MKTEIATPNKVKDKTMKSATPITITEVHDGRTFTANFTRSEDAGYCRGGLLLDLPGGNLLSIRRNARDNAWLCVEIHNGVGVKSYRHRTRRNACESAARQLFAAQLAKEQYVP